MSSRNGRGQWSEANRATMSATPRGGNREALVLVENWEAQFENR